MIISGDRQNILFEFDNGCKITGDGEACAFCKFLVYTDSLTKDDGSKLTNHEVLELKKMVAKEKGEVKIIFE